MKHCELQRAFFMRCIASVRLFDAEFLSVAIKRKAFACDEPNLKHGFGAFKFGGGMPSTRPLPLSTVFQTVGKSFPLRTNSVHRG